jgi:hypothetical protein
MMEQQQRVERYRKLANRYADLAKTAELHYMGDFFRKTAVRYVLMAEDLEKWPGPRVRISSQNDLSLWDRAEHFLTVVAERPVKSIAADRRLLPDGSGMVRAGTRTIPK